MVSPKVHSKGEKKKVVIYKLLGFQHLYTSLMTVESITISFFTSWGAIIIQFLNHSIRNINWMNRKQN